MRCTPTGRDFVLRYEVLLEWDADSVSGRDPDSPDTLRAVGVLVGIARGSYVAALCCDLSPTTLKKTFKELNCSYQVHTVSTGDSV